MHLIYALAEGNAHAAERLYRESNTSTYANSEIRGFQISTIRLSSPPIFITETDVESVPESDEMGNLIEEVVNLARQINLEVDRDDVKNCWIPPIRN
ncbi:hypothetical protein TNCV_323271 [Trichonephila clavipes]|nr:hypothetical protein TNCV_323271 [Trichonephila clavipes]